MVGFNEETQNDFEESLEFVKKVGFEKVHVFPYSERTGTAASKRGDSVTKSEKEKRAAVMIKETEDIRRKFLENQIGKTVNVLIEGRADKDYLRGYTKNYTPVLLKCKNDLTGLETDCVIHSVKDDECIANLDF